MSEAKVIFNSITSPDFKVRDMKFQMFTMFNGEEFLHSQQPLLDYLFYDYNLYDYGTSYKIPVYYISGDSDWTAPYPLVQEYYNQVEAPKKDMVFIKNAGHNPFLDKPEEFTNAVRSLLEK